MFSDILSRAFDSWIPYGKTAANPYEHASALDAVLDRKRLGIARGLLWNLRGDAYSAAVSNLELSNFCRDADERNRYFPVFAVQPAELLVRDGLDRFSELLSKTSRKGLRLISHGREEYFHLGLRVLEGVASGTLIFLEASALPPLRSLIEGAGYLPDCKFVVCGHGWDSHAYVHAAMAASHNILTDTSLLHAQGGLELFVERYGADRIIFSLGYRSWGGASLGAIQASNICASDKERILFKNVESMLELSNQEDVGLDAPEVGEHWSRYLDSGRADFPIIDAHGHFGTAAAWPVGVHNAEQQVSSKSESISDENIAFFISSGIEALKGDPLEGNALHEQLLAVRNDPRLLAYFVYNPNYRESLDSYLSKVANSKIFVGFKTLCDYWEIKISDPRFDAMWKAADADSLPVLIHTWAGKYSSPIMLDGIAAAYPRARLILAHCGGTDEGRLEAEAMARKHPNVFLEWCGTFYSKRLWRGTLSEVGAERLLFGTDAMAHSHSWELSRLLSQPFSDEEFRAILHDNMAKILAPIFLRDRTQLLLSSHHKTL